MSTSVWQKLGSPTLQPSTTTLCSCDGHPTRAQGILLHVPLTLAGKTVLIDIEVVNTQLDYNLLLGQNYMYAMRALASTVFLLMMFPHDGNIVTMDQLTYHDPQRPTTPYNDIPTMDTSIIATSMMAYFPLLPPPLAVSDTVKLCILSSKTIAPKP